MYLILACQTALRMLGKGRPIMKTPRPSLSEKLIPSDNFPPTTDSSKAPEPDSTTSVYSWSKASVVVAASRDS